MKATQIAIRPTQASEAAGRPALTPELLASVLARFSRNPEGLQAILGQVELGNERETLERLLAELQADDYAHEKLLALDKIASKYREPQLEEGIDRIFAHVDYGHQSIADMVPVAIAMEGVSLQLIHAVLGQCQVMGAQETSTRYCKFDQSGLVDANVLGIPESEQENWRSVMQRAFDCYDAAHQLWSEIFETYPEAARIPKVDLEAAAAGERKAQLKVDRMKRNFVFDRARYWIPAACRNNFGIVMFARDWAKLVSRLRSHPLAEYRALGETILPELELAAPRMIRHAVPRGYWTQGFKRDFRKAANNAILAGLDLGTPDYPGKLETELATFIRVHRPHGWDEHEDSLLDGLYARGLEYHENRYADLAPIFSETGIELHVNAIALAELRDLCRQRPGKKHCNYAPVGFYGALDQLDALIAAYPENTRLPELRYCLVQLIEEGRAITREARDRLAAGDPTYLYYTLLGTEYEYKHLTTADHAVYIWELRTGVGAHFRYADIVRRWAEEWFETYPSTRYQPATEEQPERFGIRLGSAEPE